MANGRWPRTSPSTCCSSPSFRRCCSPVSRWQWRPTPCRPGFPDACTAPWARPGVSAQLEIVTSETAPPALAVPNAAIQRDGLAPVLFRRDPADPDGSTTDYAVYLGRRTDPGSSDVCFFGGSMRQGRSHETTTWSTWHNTNAPLIAQRIAEQLREGLNRRVEADHTQWMDDLGSAVQEGRVVRALRLSHRTALAPRPPRRERRASASQASPHPQLVSTIASSCVPSTWL